MNHKFEPSQPVNASLVAAPAAAPQALPRTPPQTLELDPGQNATASVDSDTPAAEATCDKALAETESPPVTHQDAGAQCLQMAPSLQTGEGDFSAISNADFIKAVFGSLPEGASALGAPRLVIPQPVRG